MHNLPAHTRKECAQPVAVGRAAALQLDATAATPLKQGILLRTKQKENHNAFRTWWRYN
jgi:hypothetical protein